MAELIGTSISRKRITSKQINRVNPQNLKSTEEYYRVTVFLPYIDNFISQLTDRFVNHKNVLRGLKNEYFLILLFYVLYFINKSFYLHLSS